MKLNKKIFKFTEYLVFRFVIGILQLIPFKWRIIISKKLLTILSLLLKKNVNLIKKNIQNAFPEKSPEWVNEIAEKNIKGMGQFIAEFLELPYLGKKKSRIKIVYEPSEEETKDWFKDGGILILGHIGNWEWHGYLASSWLPGQIYALAKRQSNPWSNRFFEKIRQSGGVQSVFIDKGFFQYIRLIKSKKMLCFLADQDAGKNGLFFNFLNQPASTFQGPAVISRVTGCKAYFAYSQHENGQLHTYIEKIESPSIDAEKNPDEWDRQFTQTWVSRLEEVVKKYPADYFWAHNRWKTKPSKPV